MAWNGPTIYCLNLFLGLDPVTASWYLIVWDLNLNCQFIVPHRNLWKTHKIYADRQFATLVIHPHSHNRTHLPARSQKQSRAEDLEWRCKLGSWGRDPSERQKHHHTICKILLNMYCNSVLYRVTNTKGSLVVSTYNRASIYIFRIALAVLHFQANPRMVI